MHGDCGQRARGTRLLGHTGTRHHGAARSPNPDTAFPEVPAPLKALWGSPPGCRVKLGPAQHGHWWLQPEQAGAKGTQRPARSIPRAASRQGCQDHADRWCGKPAVMDESKA